MRWKYLKFDITLGKFQKSRSRLLNCYLSILRTPIATPAIAKQVPSLDLPTYLHYNHCNQSQQQQYNRIE